jgi:manganese/iron transport system ATP-binding protein
MTSFLRHSAAHDTHRPSVELEDVSVRYDGAVALAGVSLRLNRGDLAAVVGPNGAGKSTLFNVIAGAIRPATGQVRIYGSGPAGHICVAYVPQRRHVDWSFPVNVHDVVMMGRIGKMGLFRWPGRRDHQVVQAALADVGMGEFAGRQIGELSGGQQQRVFLARALAQEAEVVLLDEPLTGLDAPSQEIMLRLVAELHGRGITILVATHDLQQAAEQFPLVALLNRRLVAFGPPPAVLTTQNLLEAYGGQMHVVHTDTGDLLLTDTCCGGGEALAIPGELGSPPQP